jgi:hypothetical protein
MAKPTTRAVRTAPFTLTEYDKSFQTFLSEAIQEVAFAREPLLAEIPIEDSHGSIGSVIQDQDGKDVELIADPVQAAFSMSREDVLQGRIVPLLLLVDDASRQLAEGLAKNMIQTLNTITSATGNITNASGRPMIEVLIEALETIELTLNDNDELEMPSVLMNPADVAKLPKPTPDQERRLEEVRQRRLEELLARRRSRRLS